MVNHPEEYSIRIYPRIKMSIPIVDLDRVLFWLALSATCFSLDLRCSFLFWCEVEFEVVDNLESEVGVVRDEDVVWEELATFLDGVIIFPVVLAVSRVGLSALLSLVMSVCVSTEVKMVLVTLAHDLAIQTNLRASGYEMFLSTFIDWIALLCKIDSF